MLDLGTSGRLLLVGPGPTASVEEGAPEGAEVRSIPGVAELASAPGPWDQIVVTDTLEHERWDRWLLQRLHRMLAPGGILILYVPDLLDVGSLEGLGYLASRIVKEVRRRLAPRRAIPAADRSAFKGRRYTTGRLATMATSVGFGVGSSQRVVHRLPDGSGWRTTRSVMLMGRKLPSLWGPDRPFPACDTVRAAYAASHAADLHRRDAWRREHGATEPPREVDIADWSRRGAIVLSPHPDDEVIGCGGTLLDIVARGGAVTLVQVTDGSDSAAFIDEPEAIRMQVRLDEAKVVADRLGARELVCLRADNRALRATDELRARVRDSLERSRAGLVFAPSFTDIHPDHQVVLELLAGALRNMPGPKPDVVLYEVWSLVAPTHVHAVDARMNELEALLFHYETALKVDDYVHLMADRLLFNACTYLGRSGYGEAFEVLTAERFLALAEAGAARRAGGASGT